MNDVNNLENAMEQMNIEPPPTESVSAWEAIYNYINPELQREYDRSETVFRLFTEPGALTPQETETELNRYRNEMLRVLHVNRFLRRMAGYRHN
jgi:hypothetical protein